MRNLENDARFANMLDECCQRVQRGEPLARCLPDYPAEYRDELERLVPVSARVSLLTRDPSPEFQARLEQEFLARVDERRRAQPSGVFARLGRFLASTPLARAATIAAAVVILLGAGGVGMDRASAGSLPDSPLYSVKTAKEQVQLALARGPESQVDVHVAQLSQRDQELDQAVQGGKQPKVVETVVNKVETAVTKMVDQALVARGKGNPAPARRALVAIRTAERRLNSITPSARPNVQPALQELREFLAKQGQRLGPGAAQS